MLRLWCKLAAAAPIERLAWELPYATGAAQKSKTKTKAIQKELDLLTMDRGIINTTYKPIIVYPKSSKV